VVDPLKTWEVLFQRARVLIDDVHSRGVSVDDWTFGGGTVLMRRHNHRLSKDIDIFVNDPQCLGYVTPRLSQAAEDLTKDYAEAHLFVKLRFPEGEIDFVAAPPLTQESAATETLFGRPFLVETSTEIVAKKVWHRADHFTSRDIFDLAMVAEREPQALHEIAPILRDRRETILAVIENKKAFLRESFNELAILDYKRTFEECVEIVTKTLG